MALVFQFVLLANHRDVQEKVVDEIHSVIGYNGITPTLADLNKLQYLEMVIKECLRLYPSVGTVAREVTEELQLSMYYFYQKRKT